MNFILLAAGLGKRMGMNKALMLFRGKPWILTQLEQITEAGFQNISIVTNPNSAIALEKIQAKARLLINPSPEKGPFSSLQLAIAAGPTATSFICPVDVPLTSTTLKKLKQAWRQDDEFEALIPTYQGRKGHPIILSSRLQKSLLGFSPDHPGARLDFILKKLPENKKAVLALEDSHIVRNLNTPEYLLHFSEIMRGKTPESDRE